MNEDRKELISYLRRRWSSLKQERYSWLGVWDEISRFVVPDMGRFRTAGKDKGERRDQAILDNTATRALRTLAAGLLAGLSSPSQPWLEFRTGDRKLRDNPAVKEWLTTARDAVLEVFARSNAYRVLHVLYEELAAFGTAAAVIAEDFENVVHLHALTAGSFCIATDAKGNVNTIYREFSMTVEQLVEQFGIENVTEHVSNLYKNKQYDIEITVIHAIEPRRAGDRKRPGALGAAFREIYFEDANADKILRESGYERFNVVAPRWIVNGENTYGVSPARESLGDIKQLQHAQLRKAQAIDYQTKPPVQGPANLKGNNSGLLPGGYSPVDTANPQGGIRPVFEVRLDLQHLTADIQDTRQRISRTFFEDLFRMISDLDRSGVTARQIAEQHSEKMMLMGPVLERVQNECLGPLAELTFEMLLQAGALPEPPEELRQTAINVEFVSILAQAQKQAGASAVDRWIATVGTVAPLIPDIIDKIDGDAIADEYAHMLGVNPKLVRVGEELDMLRQQRQQQQQAAMQAEQQAQQASTAKDMASAQAAPAGGGGGGGGNTAQQLDIARFLGG